MATYKIVVDRGRCIGCRICTRTCPEYWETARDGYARLRNSRHMGGSDVRLVAAIGDGLEAAQSCPVGCIRVYGSGWNVL